MKKTNAPYTISSITEQHRLLGLPGPKHPLVTVFRFEDVHDATNELFGLDNFYVNFYCVAIKKNFTGKLKYGQRYYDFDEGVLSFISPRQLLSQIKGDDTPTQGISLMFHPDFIAGYPLAADISRYGFFSYEVNEALHLSADEEAVIEGIMQNIEKEYQAGIDHYSQGLMITQIELLLQYSNRFWNRQFITRKTGGDELLIRLENLLAAHFNTAPDLRTGLPTVKWVSEQLHVSPTYLSDMLRSTTGITTQAHIHQKLIDKSKELLSTTTLSISEIAYQLGFDYPQSFNKLFRNKTTLSPSAFRESFN